MDRIETRGASFEAWTAGEGGVVCVHGTGTTSEVWRGLAEALGDDPGVLAYDRRGWGGSALPEGYRATTLEEQAEDLVAILEHTGDRGRILCGVGFGAVVALSVALRHPHLVGSAVVIEPPLLALVPAATAGLAADRQRLESVIADGGLDQALDLYFSGGLPFLGADADRLPGGLAAREARSLFAELPAVAAWPIPFAELQKAELPSLVVTCRSTPGHVETACAELASRLSAAELLELPLEGLPHVEGAIPLAERIVGL